MNGTKAAHLQAYNVLHLKRQTGGVPPKYVCRALVMIPLDPGLQEGRDLPCCISGT